MSEPGHCPQCGCELPAHALSGLCPQCLLKAGLEPPSQIKSGVETESAPRPAVNGFVAPTPEELANIIPQIEILELLAKGGMGAVYKGRQKSLDRLVAVKILPPGIVGDSAFADRFTREARALGKLNHPNIVAVYDFGHANGLYYFVMEYVDGANLRQLLREKSLSPKEALAVVPPICDALQFAHDEGIIHRDIKPENILIDKKGRVKIADFGLAKLLGQDHAADNLTATHQVMGTLKYMAPEQMEGAKDIDHRADIYSLGVVFYELLTGELPLGRFAPPSKKVQIDVRLDEIVLRALEKEPNQRYQHAGDVKTEVETVVRTPHEAPQPAKTGDHKQAGPAKAGQNWLFKQMRSLGAEFDEIDRPYARWVGFPMLGFAGFCLLVMVMRSLTAPHPYQSELLSMGFACVCLAFLALHVIWLVRRAFGAAVAPSVESWTQQQVVDRLRHAESLLKVTGILTFVSWLVLTPALEWSGLFVFLAGFAGMIIYIGGRDLAKNREPGTVALVLALAPLSPAAILGLPVSLQILRMLGRPEVQVFFAAKARERETAKATA